MRLTRRAVLFAALAGRLAAQVPAPPSHFGHAMGEDRKLLDWDAVVSYFDKLAKASPRIKVEELGKTAEGRPFIAATIASPETLQHLPRYIDIQRRLADPRLTSDAQAEALIAQGKTVVLITCSIHSTEVASTHTAVEFAYRILTEDRPKFRTILDNTIFILVPSLNPDGVDIVTRWYRRTLGTPFEGTSPPELYHKYVGHDNNRDWYIFSQPETRLVISKLHNVWHPHIVYDVHQQRKTSSRIFVPPWLDPIEPNIDPILAQEMNAIGAGMAMDLTAAGKTGVAINAAYDFWTPARHYQAFHGGLRILTESASADLATPVEIRTDQLDQNPLGYNAQQSSWNHLEPWAGGTWRQRDIVDYQMIAWESCLYQAAIRREDLLRNFYRIGKRQVARKTPYAFLIPAKQRDPGATRRLIQTLVFGQVEIEKETDGSYRIRMAQPYSGYAKALLEKQSYPDLRMYPGGPPRRPYDVTAHTLPLLMGVDVRTILRPFNLAAVEPVPAPPAGRLSASDTDTWVEVNKIWTSGGKVWRDPKSGDFATSQIAPEWKPVNRPRVALYKAFVPSMDEGWTRWLLEQVGFEYASAGNADILRGSLKQRYDAIIMPDMEAREIAEGYAPGRMPEEYTGGLGEKGAAALREFASAGGTVVFLNHATGYASRLGLKLKNVIEGVSQRDFYSPGSLLNVRVDTAHPIAYGVPAEIAIWSERSPAWQLEEDSGARVIARYPDSKILASGWLLGDKVIAGRAALVDYPLGKGHVVLFGMRPQYRAQSYLTFKLLFNALVL